MGNADTPPVPDAAKDIVMDVLIDTDERFDDVPRAVVAALAAAGWLHDPAEVEHLRARARVAELEAAGRELVDTIDRADYGEASRAITGASDDFRAVLNTIPKG